MMTNRTKRLCAAVVLGFIGAACGAAGTAPPAPPLAETDGLQLGPVKGLTTAWHPAPKRTGIPLSSLAQFRIHADESAIVYWTGAVEIERTASDSTAVCPLVEPGEQSVQVVVVDRTGWRQFGTTLDVIDIAPGGVELTALDVRTEALELETALPGDTLNEMTVDLFFGPSIAAVREIGTNRFRTSTNRPIAMSATIEPPGFAPLIEWRVDGQVYNGLGAQRDPQFTTVGQHEISVGPPGSSETVHVETYAVTITSHTEGEDEIPENELVTFTAATDPPGYEDEITWLAATKFGAAEPTLGIGPTFTCTFRNTFGPHPDGGIWQWIGVKADQMAMGQDEKVGYAGPCVNCPGADVDCWCEYEIVGLEGNDCANPEFNLFIGKGICLYPCDVGINCPPIRFGLVDLDGIVRDCDISVSPINFNCKDCTQCDDPQDPYCLFELIPFP